MLWGEGGGSLEEEQNQGLPRAVQLMYPPRAKSIFIHSSAPAAEHGKDFSTLEPPVPLGLPPTAQIGHALESSSPKNQWLHQLHQPGSKQHEVPCCPPAQPPGAGMSPGHNSGSQFPSAGAQRAAGREKHCSSRTTLPTLTLLQSNVCSPFRRNKLCS